MKIAILSNIYPSSVLTGQDIEKYNLRKNFPHTNVHNLVEILANELKNDVHLISFSNEFSEDMSFIIKNVNYTFLKHTGKYKRAITFYESDRRKLHAYLLQRKFDIVHGQGTQIYGYYATSSNFNNVITIHIYFKNANEIIKHYLNKSLFSIFYAFLTVWHEKTVYNNTRNFICSSPFLAKKVKRANRNARFFSVENAISRKFFETSETTNEDYALFVGSICERKSVLELLQALKFAKDVKLKIVSTTYSGPYYSRVKDFVRENGLEPRVKFCGSMRNDEVVQILSRCSFLVLPSKQEGAPLVVAEAMALGKPVIATSVNEIPHMVEDGRTGYLIEPVNVEEFGKKMEFLAKRKKLCAKMGKTAQNIAFGRWHPDSVASQMMDVYEQVLSN